MNANEAYFISDRFARGFKEGWKDGERAMSNDPVNHPAHYTQGSVECIDAMEAAFGKEELAIYCKIAAFKYIWRCEHKDGVKQDLEKAQWYIDKALELIEKE